MLYRILTESINHPEIVSIVSARFPGFTMIVGHGYWKGCYEQCLIIEIVTDDIVAVEAIAFNIKQANNQESVLIQEIDCRHRFV